MSARPCEPQRKVTGVTTSPDQTDGGGLTVRKPEGEHSHPSAAQNHPTPYIVTKQTPPLIEKTQTTNPTTYRKDSETEQTATTTNPTTYRKDAENKGNKEDTHTTTTTTHNRQIKR